MALLPLRFRPHGIPSRRAPRCAGARCGTTWVRVAAAALALGLTACNAASGGGGSGGGSSPRVVPAEPIPATALVPEVDLDSLAGALAVRADTLHPSLLPALETEIRDWLGRLEYGDPALLPFEATPEPFFRRYRGLLLDTLGWSAFRRGDLRQAEAALVSAVEAVNSRGRTDGPASHFLHLGRVHAARGRWRQATEAFLAAEQRGGGARATPDLEAAHRRWRGSLRGLDALRVRERARIEDERRQLVVADPDNRPLLSFLWPRRTGPPLSSGELVGRPFVLAVWGDACEGCPGWAHALEPLAEGLAARGAALVAVWVGADPAGAGPPQRFTVLLPEDPAEAGRLLGASPLPALLVVDVAGRIRYRHGGTEAAPPPVEDVLLQIDHLKRRRG